MTDAIAQMRDQMRDEKYQSGTKLGWLAPVRMFVIAIIAFGYASTMPRGLGEAEYLNLFGYDPSWIGIQIIFMITGFLALRSLQRHGSAFKFLISRFARNIPTLVVFTGVVILALYPLFGNPLGAENGAWETRLSLHLQYFVKVVTCFDPDVLTPGLLDDALYMCVIQGGIWTFRWGVIAFVATAMMWVVGGLKNRRFLAMLTFALVMLYTIIFVYAMEHTDTYLSKYLEFAITGLRLGGVYMVGMCVYAYREDLPRSLAIPAGFLALAGVQFFFLAWTPFIEISMELGFGYLAFLAMTSRRKVPMPIQALPDLSLGLYIYNWPAAQIALLVMPSLTPYPLFAISFPVTVFLSYTTWFLFSRKINIRVAQRLSSQPA